ncbi:hypothetical protein D1B31_18465 [Neobacillus notoginsengisoli]|uniref:Uncharacterized protein n=1 Tax=Neobacillus notoginsengisoli TaxID=1578198 RepID=A0A417YQE6_9BACI|nr:hypothetical protein [Neobacillus notoginsengisoli]RHW36062.1 hypothetical protein D1B31_18465 [Neobacillus notoginsengisoli]
MLVTRPSTEEITLERDKIYRALLTSRKNGYPCVPLKHYYISPLKTHCDFYEDAALTKFRGCFPIQEVSLIIEETSLNESLTEEINNPIPQATNEEETDFRQLTLF